MYSAGMTRQQCVVPGRRDSSAGANIAIATTVTVAVTRKPTPVEQTSVSTVRYGPGVVSFSTVKRERENRGGVALSDFHGDPEVYCTG